MTATIHFRYHRAIMICIGFLFSLSTAHTQQLAGAIQQDNSVAEALRVPGDTVADIDEWIPLNRDLLLKMGQDLLQHLRKRGYDTPKLASLFWAEIGSIVEVAALESLSLPANIEAFNGTVPDGVARIVNGKIWQGWPKAIFVEVKVSHNIPSRERDRQQLLKMIEYLGQVRQRADVYPALIIVTPAGSHIKPEIIQAATQAEVTLMQAEMEAHVFNNKVVRVGAAKTLNLPLRGVRLWNFLRIKHGRPVALAL